MLYIVGLGNIGDIYKGSRHNTGFEVLDTIASDHDVKINKKGLKYSYCKLKIFQNDVMLIKPNTFVNLSGEAIDELIAVEKMDISELLVVYDDMDIMLGDIKLKTKGDSAGHNGIKSIINSLGSNVFNRVKVGIGRPAKDSDSVDFVLSRPKGEDELLYEKGIDKAVLTCQMIVKMGFDFVLNRVNYNKDKDE